jgi:P4 family phage/plasmid primase-like protien
MNDLDAISQMSDADRAAYESYLATITTPQPAAPAFQIEWTSFTNKTTPQGVCQQNSWADICQMIANATEHTDPNGLPLIKLGIYNSNYRSDNNLLSISGIEGDIDSGLVPFDAAVALLTAAKVEALVYTTRSHRPEAPRLRILCPTSTQYVPGMRHEFVARLNGVLKGALANESFTPSQAFFFGRVAGVPEYRTARILGDFIDRRADLPQIDRPRQPKRDVPAIDWTGHDQPLSDADRAVVDQMLKEGNGPEHAGFAGMPVHAHVRDLWAANVGPMTVSYPPEGERKDGLPYDASDADFALVSKLAFYTGKNAGQMYRILFHHPDCKLRRKKWYDNNGRYLNVETIPKVLANQDKVYTGRQAGAGPAPAAGTEPAQPQDDGYVPVAKHLTTDQANAKRIFNHFGGRILYSEGRWYGWNGRVWAPQEKEAWKSAQQLSELVSAEAEEWKAKAEAKRAAQDPLMGSAEDQNYEALKKHSIKCEAKAMKESALGELAKLISIDINLLDADPWLLNCQNGIVDLRTGTQRPHDQAALMTKITPGNYNPAATCPKFESFILQIMGGDAGMVAFLQRWFGYCSTGSVQEQKFAIHHGKGSNGKGTLLGAIQDALGTDYADEMAEGLLTGSTKNERHPCDVADLRGQRMMTSSETKEDETMKEAFIKKATGGDRMKGRFMRQDFFSFTPTHKLQLQTNWPPRILGTDYAIWRRVMMIPYSVKFREPHEDGPEVVKDLKLPETLKAERDGILAWIVRGAVAWSDQGLNPPKAVLVATKNYQNEQDVISQFVRDCCEVGQEFKSYFSLPDKFIPHVLPGSDISFDAIYPRYRQWCDANGYHALSTRRFTPELQRAVPSVTKTDSSIYDATSRKKANVVVLKGIR